MKQLHLLPLIPEETVEQRVGSFRSHEDEVRCCLPDVLLATMSILYTLYKQTRSGDKQTRSADVLLHNVHWWSCMYSLSSLSMYMHIRPLVEASIT